MTRDEARPAWWIAHAACALCFFAVAVATPAGAPARTGETEEIADVGSKGEVDRASARGWTVELETALLTHYVWRGQLLTDSAVLQPAVTVENRGFGLELWGNVELDDAGDVELESDEIDLTAYYDRSFDAGGVPLDLSVGAIGSSYPGSEYHSTVELFAGVALDVPLGPSLTVYEDVVDIEGRYVTLELGHSLEAQHFELGFDLGVGWADSDYNAGYFEVDEAGFSDVTTTVWIALAAGRVVVTPSLSFSSLLDDALRDSCDDPDNWHGGVALGVAF